MVLRQSGGSPFSTRGAAAKDCAGVASHGDFQKVAARFVECEEAAGAAERGGKGFGGDELGRVFEDLVDRFVDDLVVEADEGVLDCGVNRVAGWEGELGV